MSEATEDLRPPLFLFTPSADFVRPYFERYMPEYRISDTPDDAQVAAMISTTAVYDVTEGSNFNELTAVNDNSEQVAEEKHFANICRKAGLPVTILRCADIVCTGMDGRPREMAQKIYRGTYIALDGNDARMSVVHAASLPDAARAVIGNNDVYNVTDGTDPTINEFAEALAWRIAQKRIFSLKPKWYKLLFGKKKLEDANRTLTFSCEKIRSTGKYTPVSVTEYLKTHVYNQESL